jgi:hypothetical protein
MKNVLIGILFVTTAVFGGLYLSDTRGPNRAAVKPDELQATLSELQSKLREQVAQTDSQRKEMERARLELLASTQEATKLRETVKTLQARPSQPSPAPQPAEPSVAAGETNSRAASPLADLLKNPDMKEMIQSQQRLALVPMIEKNYGKLFSDLHLTPEQTTSVKDLIMKKMLDSASMGLSLVGGDLDSENVSGQRGRGFGEARRAAEAGRSGKQRNRRPAQDLPG